MSQTIESLKVICEDIYQHYYAIEMAILRFRAVSERLLPKEIYKAQRELRQIEYDQKESYKRNTSLIGEIRDTMCN